MSYDVNIGNHSFNYTSNLSGFFHDHVAGQDTGLQTLHGLKGKDAAVVLKDAFKKIRRTRDSFFDRYSNTKEAEEAFRSQYEPKNGWGSVMGAMIIMTEIMIACNENPEETVSVFY